MRSRKADKQLRNSNPDHQLLQIQKQKKKKKNEDGKLPRGRKRTKKKNIESLKVTYDLGGSIILKI